MKSTGHSDLDWLHRMYQEHKEKRWAVVRWVTEVTYYDSQEKARNVLARMPVGQRAGLVDRETGHTWCSKPCYPPVMAALRKAKRAPQHFRRIGKIGPIKPKVKARGPYRVGRR